MGSESDLFNQLVDNFNDEYAKFQKGNKTAGTRARKALSELSKLCKSIRQDIQQQKNSL